MKNQGRKSITLSLQVSVIGNIPSGNFKLGSPKEVFLIKNITDEAISLSVKPAGSGEFKTHLDFFLIKIMSKKAKASSNIIAEIPWNDGTGDKVYVNYNPNEKSQTINITSDFNFGNQPRDLIITIQTNSPNIDPDLQVKFSLLVTQQVDNTRVVATFDNKKSYIQILLPNM